MKRRHFLRGALATAAITATKAVTLGAPPPTLAPARRPNIVVILADDMGYSDVGCYGGEISTPNLDRLARNGVRFTQVYNTARCCPSRAALLTGLYPHQAGVGHMTEEHTDASGNVLPGYSGRLNDRCVTIAEALKSAGYFTAMAGKWHVGQNFGVAPWNRGFDQSIDSAAGGVYFPETTGGGPLWLNGKNVGRTDAPLPEHWYSSDLWVDFGLKFIDQARTGKKPFFLYLPFNAPHFPLQAPPEDIARWRGKYRAGWDKLREARYRRQIAMGLVDKDWPLSPRLPAVPAWDSLTPEQQDRYDHIMAIYAAVVERMDRAVGTLVEGLRRRGELDNTLILFLSDNGGNAESGVPGRLEGKTPGDAESTVYVGQCWATLNNTPLVRYKHYTDEGGISTPLIAHWPKGIPAARDGQFERQPGHVIDVMATCLDVAGAAYPAVYNGKPITPLQGVSLRPGFSGKPLNRKSPLFWEHESNRAVRDGDWKLVALAGQPWRLYDLAADRTEQHDLAGVQPARVKALAAEWDAWAARSDVLPLGGWRAPSPQDKRAGSKAAHFTLKPGESLDRKRAPSLAGRAFTITAKFDSAADAAGVIVAQGGRQIGYTLFVTEGKLTFLLRTDGQTAAVRVPLAPGAHTAVAALTAADELKLTLDGGPTASGRAPGKITRQPADGLDVGQDTKGAVGPYEGPFAFAGTIRSVEITLSRAGAAAAPPADVPD